MTSPYMTVAEAAELLRLKPYTVRRMISDRVFKEGIHYVRPPRMRPRFLRVGLAEFMAGRSEVVGASRRQRSRLNLDLLETGS